MIEIAKSDVNFDAASQELSRQLSELEQEIEQVNDLLSESRQKLDNQQAELDKMNEGINLYSTGYNFSKGQWNDRWTPDFMLTENRVRDIIIKKRRASKWANSRL